MDTSGRHQQLKNYCLAPDAPKLRGNIELAVRAVITLHHHYVEGYSWDIRDPDVGISPTLAMGCPDNNFMQGTFLCCFTHGMAGMSRDLGRAACLQNETAPEKLLNRCEKRLEKREKRSEKRSETRPKKTFSPSQASPKNFSPALCNEFKKFSTAQNLYPKKFFFTARLCRGSHANDLGRDVPGSEKLYACDPDCLVQPPNSRIAPKSIGEGASSLFGEWPGSPENVSCSRATPRLHQSKSGALEQKTFSGLPGHSPKRLLAPSPIDF